MGRKAQGSIKPYRGKFRVRFAGVFVGLFETQHEAAAALQSARGLHAQEKATPGALVTLRPYGTEWFKQRELDGFVRSVGKERSLWNRHILHAPFIDWPLKQIATKPAALQKWLTALTKTEALHADTIGRKAGDEASVIVRGLGRTLSKKSMQNIRHVLRQILVQAEIDRLITSNPLTKDLRVKVPARIREEEVWTFLVADEITQVIASLSDGFVRAFFAVAIYAGLRQGEILGLRWRDLVFDRNRPFIRVRRNRNGPVKTETSIRDVEMLYPLFEALKEWQAETHLEAAKGRLLSNTVIDINALVFPSDGGGCFAQGYDCGWRDRSYRKNGVLTKYPGRKAQAGITRHGVTFHALRHTCASHLAMGDAGFPKLSKEEIARWLGHSSTRVTERYMHLDPSAYQERVGRLFRFELQAAEQREAADALA